MSQPPPVSLARLDSFLPDRRSLNRDEFLRKYPSPMLVIALAQDDQLENEGAFRTEVISTGTHGSIQAAAAHQAAVAPVTKRMADAFQAFIWVGRETRCDVSLPFDSISKLQAQFVKRPTGEFDLIDAGSTNGTWLENEKLPKNKPALIRDGAKIRFGKVETRFRSAEGFWEELGRYV